MKKLTVGLLAGVGLSLLAAGAFAGGDRGGKGFDRLDTNKDGEISASEIAAGDARREARRAEHQSRRADMLAAADTDGNGSVSREEMDAYRDAKRAARSPDKNGDGVVDRTEYLQKAQERFDRQDKNGDGVLSEDEQRRRGHGRRHRDRG